MKFANQTWIPLLEEAIRTSIDRFPSGNEEDFLADLYIYPDEEYMLHFHDDMERELHSVQLDPETEEDTSKFPKQLSHSLRAAIQKLEEEKIFNRSYIFKPFTVSLIDKDFIVSEELIFIDDDTVKLDGELLAGLDEDLNTFFRDLMGK